MCVLLLSRLRLAFRTRFFSHLRRRNAYPNLSSELDNLKGLMSEAKFEASKSFRFEMQLQRPRWKEFLHLQIAA